MSAAGGGWIGTVYLITSPRAIVRLELGEAKRKKGPSIKREPRAHLKRTDLFHPTQLVLSSVLMAVF